MTDDPTRPDMVQMREEIIHVAMANGLPTNELWITLIFRSRRELVTICRELHIQVPPVATT